MKPLTRRSLVGRGLAGAGALALPGSLVAATAARAQESDAETDALERFVELEQAAELAYSLAAEEGELSNGAQTLFEELSIHSGDRATAFSEALDQLLIEATAASSDVDDYDSLEDFDPASPEEDLLAFMIDLELDTIAAYEEDEPDLDEPDLVRSAAQMAASHAQALVALRLLIGDKVDPAALSAPSSSASDS